MRLVIFIQLTEVEIKCWSEESKNLVVVNKILEGLRIPENSSDVHVPILNEAVAKMGQLCHFIKELIRDDQIFKKG